MTDYAAALDALTTEAAAALAIPATRDPSAIPGFVSSSGVCLFIGFPTGFSRLLDGTNIDVPVTLLAPAPGTLPAVNVLLSKIDALMEFCGASTFSPRPMDFGDLTYPAVMVTARIAL